MRGIYRRGVAAASVPGLVWLALSVAGACTTASAQERKPGVASARTAEVRLRSIAADARTGTARAVVVEAGALVHTALLVPDDVNGRLQGDGDARAQAVRVLENIEQALREADTGLEHLVRLHVYVADASVTPVVEGLLAQRLAGATKPAVTLVETRMARAGVLVAMDAVAATSSPGSPGVATRLKVPALREQTARGAHVALQPMGAFAIVSGRAAPGEFEAAIRATMEQLRDDLHGVGLTFDHTVHVKSFLGDMAQAGRLQEIVAEFFGDAVSPPQVVTEWLDAGAPAEIELVAVAPPRDAGTERLAYIEPIASRFSRVVRVDSGRPVFVSGLHGSAVEPVIQVREAFAELQDILRKAGSDMRHLVKATYYVADRGADQEINVIRPTLYDAQRPPAASKISVRGTGRAGKGSMMDMIAIMVDP